MPSCSSTSTAPPREVAHDQPIVEKVLRERATEVRVAEDEKDRTALWYGPRAREAAIVRTKFATSNAPSPFSDLAAT